MSSLKKIVTAVLIIAVLVTGSMAVSVETVSAASDPQVASTKVVTKTTTKTTNKSVKMKSKASKSKVATKITTKKTSKVISKTEEQKVTQDKTVKTTEKTTYTKNSKIKKVKTTVKTTTKTTTVTYKKSEEQEIREIRKKVPKDAISAFDQLGFKISINKNLNSTGVFSTEDHAIQLRYASAGVLLHEMGHFISCLQGKTADSEEFIDIYKAEKDKYTGSNKKYVTATNDEYFAESYRDYVEKPGDLKKERPQTYKYMDEHAHDITQEYIDDMKVVYGSGW